MNLSKIKQKYKQILEQNEPNQTESDQQWQLAYSRMKNKRRKHILTESHCMNRSSISMNTGSANDEQKYLKTKEKLAQAISNLGKKDQEIQQIRNQNIKILQQNKVLEQQIATVKEELAECQSKLVDQKVAYACIEKSMENINKSIYSQKMDKQLLQRQIQFYQSQIQTLKKQVQSKDTKIDQLRKQIKDHQKYKNFNSRLKQDITRLRELLTETEKYKVFASKIEYKNYIGKTSKEHECWVSQDIVQDVENFLRKNQIPLLHKQFANNLIKFVAKHVDLGKYEGEKRAKKIYSSKLKSTQRKQNHSMNLMQVREEQMRKSLLGSSLIKSRRNTLNDSKLFTESFIYGTSLEKSHVAHSVNKNREICIQILSSFRKGIFQMIEHKDIKKKKLVKLVDWVIQGIMTIFPKDKAATMHGGGDFRLETEQIKITL